AALGQEQGAALGWLRSQGLDSARRVGESLEVEPGWETAVEAALGQLIEGVLVESPERLAGALSGLVASSLSLVDGAVAARDVPADSAPARARARSAVRHHLERLCVEEDLAAARVGQPSLDPGYGIVPRSGVRLGAGWLQVLRDNDSSH